MAGTRGAASRNGRAASRNGRAASRNGRAARAGLVSALMAAAAVLALAGCATSAVTLTTVAPEEASRSRPADRDGDAAPAGAAPADAANAAAGPTHPDALEATMEVRPNADGTSAEVTGEARITSPLAPALTLIGDVVPSEGGVVLYLTEVRIFTNWANGWTEGRYEASGNLRLEPAGGSAAGGSAGGAGTGRTAGAGGGGAGPEAVGLTHTAYSVTLADPPQLWSVVEGEIRYYDTYYRGDDGVAKVRARVDRLRELATLLREEMDFAPVYPVGRAGLLERVGLGGGDGAADPANGTPGEGAGQGGGTSQGDSAATPAEAGTFHNAVFPFLFPEVAGEPVPEGPTRIGSDIVWSITYTENHFPERFRPLRDSGTLYRDYEEAFGLFYSFYNLPYLMTALDGAVLHLE